MSVVFTDCSSVCPEGQRGGVAKKSVTMVCKSMIEPYIIIFYFILLNIHSQKQISSENKILL